MSFRLKGQSQFASLRVGVCFSNPSEERQRESARDKSFRDKFGLTTSADSPEFRREGFHTRLTRGAKVESDVRYDPIGQSLIGLGRKAAEYIVRNPEALLVVTALSMKGDQGPFRGSLPLNILLDKIQREFNIEAGIERARQWEIKDRFRKTA